MAYSQFIDGELTGNSNRESWINYNPANNISLGEVSQANDEDIEAGKETEQTSLMYEFSPEKIDRMYDLLANSSHVKSRTPFRKKVKSN